MMVTLQRTVFLVVLIIYLCASQSSCRSLNIKTSLQVEIGVHDEQVEISFEKGVRNDFDIDGACEDFFVEDPTDCPKMRSRIESKMN
ncbi:hypothetical protein MPTK1_4g09390 [Marchantia polymorpha subsp. ruderalis]|uniref:Uncharacterized protein n=2 Tax=Marchantia polymorpha TaxID=3197 RepID=A0AAF6B832_MARPO|nr:hypothetical protein MARPO_0112s0039 [Marchantia polymorpha]BBN08166.1 hypothetical protein Mp_4g09390 [Marchantia polymorpha subsp. ruderalis]|eukprot:PTQ31391.1 hypothetical protein MARPO_0112s0039 [Marchantia polymorpha]